MDHYKTVVMDYLQSDKAVFVNADCRFQLTPTDQCQCDAVAIDLRHGAVYLCETAIEEGVLPLLDKLTCWTSNWDALKNTLQREHKVPKDWRVHVWLFVPKAITEQLEDELEQLRLKVGPRFKVKLTALEEIQPWNSSTWRRQEEPWELKKPRTLT